MKVGVIAKAHRKDFAASLKEIVQWLVSRNCEVLVENSIVENFELEEVVSTSREEIPKRADIVLVFGGDGTMLSVARSIQKEKAQILGVNLGSLGFLTEWTLEELYPALDRVLSGEHTVDTRRLLKIEVHCETGEVKTYDALNDAVINKGAVARIISMDAFVDEDFIGNFLADGMIISTPTGSTAYSLSAGGPIVYPTLDCLILTPICPHTLTNRPLVIPANSTVRVVVKSGEDLMMTVDGQIGVSLSEGDEIRCTRSELEVELVQPGERGFFDILRKKLKWGER